MDREIEVYKAIAAVQGELAKGGISKDRKNQQQGFAYRGIDDVYGALAPLVAKHNLCILPRVVSREATERTSAKGGVLFYTAVTIDFDLVSAIDGSKHTVTAVGEAFDSGDKSIGKAQSYAYKAMAFMLFAIPVEGQDNDPDAHSHEIVNKPVLAPAKTSTPVVPAGEKKPLSAEQQRYFPRAKAALDLLYGTDTEQKKTLIRRLTTFTNKEGKVINGVEDYRLKDGKGLQILVQQIEKMAADQAQGLPELCSACREDPCICGEIPY